MYDLHSVHIKRTFISESHPITVLTYTVYIFKKIIKSAQYYT